MEVCAGTGGAEGGDRMDLFKEAVGSAVRKIKSTWSGGNNDGGSGSGRGHSAGGGDRGDQDKEKLPQVGLHVPAWYLVDCQSRSRVVHSTRSTRQW